MGDSGLPAGRRGDLCRDRDSFYGRLMVDQVRTAIYPALAFERTLEFPGGAFLGGAGEENPAGNIGTPQGVVEGNAVSAPASPPPVPQVMGRPRGFMQLEGAIGMSSGGGVPASEMASKTASVFTYSYASIDP